MKSKPTKKAQRAKLHKAWRKDYETFVEIQGLGECCAICKRSPKPGGRRLAIDSDHRTNTPRGLLCGQCNRRLRYYLTSSWLRKAADYLDNPPLRDLE